MRIDLPWPWVAVLNVVMCPVLQLGFAWAFTRMPARWFAAVPCPFAWEARGEPYQRWFRVRRWKGLLPDGATWFQGGIAKARLTGNDRETLAVFEREAWRGELCHWAVMLAAPVFFLWNPWWGSSIMVVYLLAANLPCILVQRYNRARLSAIRPCGSRG